MNNPNLVYQIALTLIKGIGCQTAKNLLAYVGDVEEIFKRNKQTFLKIPNIGNILSNNIIEQRHVALQRAEKEIAFIEKHKIIPLFFTDKNFPQRLKEYDDSPVLLYYKGNAELNQRRFLSIVGTRNATEYGKSLCSKIIEDLAINQPDLTIISGLAYGIDVAAHKASLQYNVPNIGVLGHGLDKIYPAGHASVAKKMIENGGLLTEFISETNPDRQNFVMRNRIIAGMADAVLVVESASKGGALITAEIANSYNKDVFAFPGRTNDEWSAGCNKLIKQHKAALIENANDLEYMMGWKQETKKISIQKELFIELTEEEQIIYDILQKEKNIHIDLLAMKANKNINKISPLLLSMEFKGIIKCIPGNIYGLL